MKKQDRRSAKNKQDQLSCCSKQSIQLRINLADDYS